MYRKHKSKEKSRRSNKFIMAGLVVALLMTSMMASVGMVIADEDDLLGKYETGDKTFERIEISDMIVYSHKRMIDEAIVEKDFIVYQFDKNTEELLAKKMHWREDLPEHLSSIITKEKAESMVDGEVQCSRLIYISPESEVFPIEPTPENPCWTVRNIYMGKMVETVIDAVTGEILGNGIPPPYDAVALGGPDHGSCAEYYYDPYALNAQSWFNTMGYSTEALDNPDEPLVEAHVSSCETALFYELCHGGSTSFRNDCTGDQSITAAEVEAWIEDYTKMPFAFIGSCEGLVHTGPGTFSYAFRKGSMEDTVTIGYNHMDYNSDEGDPWDCRDAWANALAWQTALFTYMYNGGAGMPVKDAFDQACADFAAENCPQCMKFLGDEDFAVVPVVERGELPPETTKTVGDPKYQGEDYVTTSTDITLESEDVCSGVKEIHYIINGVEYIEFTDEVTFNFDSEGTKILEFWAVDNGDNEELHHTQTHYVDDTPPTTTLTYGTPYYTDLTDEWITTLTPITLTAVDGGITPCGVKEIHYDYGDGPNVASGDTTTFCIPDECLHTIEFYAIDNLGNVEALNDLDVYVDDTQPETAHSFGTPYFDDGTIEWITPWTPIYLDAIDYPICGPSGVKEIRYDYGAGEVIATGDSTKFMIPDDCLHNIEYYAVDNLGCEETPHETFSVEVDGTPPEIELIDEIIELWPPNHEYHTITISDFVVSVTDKFPGVGIDDIVITSVSSDELEDAPGNGDGKTIDDIVIADSQTVELRAERQGGGNGRVYTINFKVSDPLGNTAIESFKIYVRHDIKKPAIDDGPGEGYTVYYP